MKCHVYTPFFRWHNLPDLLEMLGRQHVIWHPIYERSEFPESLLPSWTVPMLCEKAAKGWHPAQWKCNWFLDHADIEDDDRYLQLSDDDWYEPSFFRKVNSVAGDVLIVTMKNGPTPDGRRIDLIAMPNNLKGGRIGGQQIVVSGHIIKNFRYGPGYGGDWDFISSIVKNHSPVYVPEAYVFWNYLPQ